MIRIMELGGMNQGEGLAIKLAAARVVAAYSKGKDLSNKMQEILRVLFVANMKDDATDEAMEELLYAECESRRLEPEEVMTHFEAIGAEMEKLLTDEE